MDTTPPGRRPFFKYTSPETALAILRNRTVRYSSPKSFNDPFDIQSGLHFNFDVQSLPLKVAARLKELASATEPPPVDPEDVWGMIVFEIWRQYSVYGFSPDRWRANTDHLFAWLVERISEIQKGYQEHWWNKQLPGVRVFCVSEERDNLLMWAHYAKDHTGAVFEFWSLPEEDNPLSVARAVEYVSEPPSFFSEAEFLDHILSIKKLDFPRLYRRYAYFKSAHWQYEREWRVWYPLSDSESHDYTSVRPSEFSALYLGCRCTPQFKADAKALAERQFPSIRIYQASRLENAYALQYTEGSQ